MAINPRKFLALPEPKKRNTSKEKNSIQIVEKTAAVSTKEIKPPETASKFEDVIDLEPTTSQTRIDSNSRLLGIEKRVIKIDNLLKDYLDRQKAQFTQNVSEQETTSRRNRERDLEKNIKKPSGVKIPKLYTPKLGLFGWIKNFISNVIMGFIAVRLVKYLPQFAKLIPIINGVMDFIIDWGGKLLNGLVTFIDWGYKAIDASRSFVSGVFGENGVKAFDTFSKNFSDLVKYSLIAAMLISNAGDSIMGGFGEKREPQGFFRRGDTREFGKRIQGGKTLGYQRLLNNKSPDVIQDIMKRYFQKYGRKAFIQRFGEEGLQRLPGGMQRGFLQRGARSAVTGILGKGGAKTVLKFIKPFTKRLPIIGAFLDFALSIALGEDIGRAAFKAIGAGILGAIGAAVGSVIPVAGNIILGVGGSMLGDWAGGALYDLFFKNKKSNQSSTTDKPEQIKNYSEGGVTRGGKHISATPQRRVKQKKAERRISPPSMSLQPGRSVGGSEKSTSDPSITKIESYYPKNTGPKEVKPHQYLETTHKTVSKVPFLGSLFGLAIKTIFGDKPSNTDYMNVSEGLNSWINTILGKLSFGYAGGGLVEENGQNEDLRNWLAITIQNTVTPRINQVINDLMRQLLLKPYSGPDGPSPAPPGGKERKDDPNAQFQGQADFVIGDDVAHGFAGRSGNGTDTDDSKKGRKPSEVLTILKSKGDALKGKLIDLSTGIAHSKDDWQIVEEQLKYLQSIGARVRLLGVGKQWDTNKGGNQVNSKLQQLASQYGAYFYGGHNASGDKELGLSGSTTDYSELRTKLESTQVSDSDIIGTVSGGKAFPLPKGRVGTDSGQVYGASRDYGGHRGVDLVEKQPWGRDPKIPVVSYAGGKVIDRGPTYPYQSSGYTSNLTIDHGGGFKATYLHMKPKLKPGDTVSAGQQVGNLIDLGNMTHLHFQAYKNNNIINPTQLLKSAPGAAFHGKYITGNDPKIIKTHDDEYVIDKDSVELFGLPFIDLINRTENKSQLKNKIGDLMKMLDYEEHGSRKIVVDVIIEEPSDSTYIVDNKTIISSFGSDEDQLAHLFDYV